MIRRQRTASSSQESQVPTQPVFIPSPKEMLGRDPELPTITRNTLGNSGNVLGDPQLEKDLPQLYSKIRESHLPRVVEWDLSRAKRTWDRGEK